MIGYICLLYCIYGYEDMMMMALDYFIIPNNQCINYRIILERKDLQST